MQRLQWKCNHLQSDRYNSPLEWCAMRRLKDSLQPALHMDLIDHSHSSRFHWNTEVELQHDYPWCLYIEAPRSTHLAGGNAAEGRTEKAVKQEKSNNVRGAIFSVPKISHPLYHDLATVRIRLTEMETHTPEEHRKHLFSFSPLMCSRTSLESLLCGCLQVCKREFGREKKVW